MKTINPRDIPSLELQNILGTAIAPRPIALVSSIDEKDRSNLSPFSFFNLFSYNPPILIFSVVRRSRDHSAKHTLENILKIPEVVIGVVNYPIIEQVSLSSADYPKEVNEFEKAGFTMKNAKIVRPKLIAECPINFECMVQEIKPLGETGGAGNLVICEVKNIHIRKEFMTVDGKIDPLKLNVVARLGGHWYSKNNEENMFEIQRPSSPVGIGFDNLPQAILYSKIFTGNDLGKLANIPKLPEGFFSDDEKIHQQAQFFLNQNKTAEAWEILKTK